MGSCISSNNRRMRSKHVLNLSELKIVLCKKRIEKQNSPREEIFQVSDSNTPNLKLIIWNKRIQIEKIHEEACAVLVK